MRDIARAAAGVVLGAAMTGIAHAGGADVSEEEVYSDDVALSTYDGQPLDLNQDGNVDLAIASNRGGAVNRSRYYLGNGDGTFGASTTLAGGASSEIIAADFDGDGNLDLLHGRRDLTDLIYLGDGAGGFAPEVEVSALTDRVLALAVGDLDGDGDLDIVTGTGHPGGSQANPLQTNKFCVNDLAPGGTMSFTCDEISADLDDTRSIALADLDGDGLPDVIAGNDETTPGGSLVIYPNLGGDPITFDVGIRLDPAGDQISKVLVGDLDGDGKPDIVTLNNVQAGDSPGINRYYINTSTVGNISFAAAEDISPDADRSSGGELLDFDDDGDLDIAVANLDSVDGSSAVNRIYLNQFEETGSVSFIGVDISPDEHKSRELAAGDLNNDGFLDIVVGNEDDVPGVRDRRYLNNGTGDPFANLVPVIDDYSGSLETDEQTDLTIALEDFDVIDDDNVFPDDFTLTVQEGDNYTVTGNTITPVANFDGELTVPVVVNDGTDDSDPFELIVTVNDTANTAPSFTSAPVTDATEGVAYSYAITAEDPDINDDVAIMEAVALPAWLTLTDNGDGTATLEGTPTDTDVGDHDVSLLVTDGVESDTQDFTILVAAAPGGGNIAPAFTSTPVEDATEDEEYSYDVTAEDADGDTLVFAAPGLPGWLTFEDHGDGTGTLSGTPSDTDVGDHAITLEVSDGTDTTEQAFTISVAAASDPSPPPQPNPPSSGGGGGSFGWASLLTLLAFAALYRPRRRLTS